MCTTQDRGNPLPCRCFVLMHSIIIRRAEGELSFLLIRAHIAKRRVRKTRGWKTATTTPY